MLRKLRRLGFVAVRAVFFAGRCLGRIDASAIRSQVVPSSDQNPFAAPLDELIKQHGQICQYKAANIEAKKFRCVSGTQFHANMGGRRMLETWVFYLSCYLICSSELAIVFFLQQF